MSVRGLLAINSKVTRTSVLTVCIINDFILFLDVIFAQELSYLHASSCLQSGIMELVWPPTESTG